MPRKEILKLGSHGRSVRVFVQTFAKPDQQDLVRVFWRENGKRRMESLPNSPTNRTTAKAFAIAKEETLRLHGATRVRLKMHELGERFVDAHPVGESWRPKTLTSWRGRWKLWVTFAGSDRWIDTVTPETLDQFRKALREQDYFVNQIANAVQMVKSVYRFARERGYVTENPIADYRMRLSRDQRRLQVPEWTAADCTKILAQLNPRHPKQWRAWVAIVLDSVLGPRSNALLHLEWRDVHLGASRLVHWRPELDKLAKDRYQPLPMDAVRAFKVAQTWRKRTGYTGPFIFPPVKKSRSGPYTYQALNYQLRQAAKDAKVGWIAYRAMHGFRRLALGNVLKLTGNITLAGQWIGDTDLRTLGQSYVRERAEDLRSVAKRIKSPRNQVATATKTPSARKR